MHHLPFPLIAVVFLLIGPLSALAQSRSGETRSVNALAAATLTGPPNGTVLQSMGAITLSFQLPAGATQYQVQVTPFNGDGPGANLIRNAEGSYTLQPPLLGSGPYVMLPGMTYNWRVRATDSGVAVAETDPSWGPWSDAWYFTTPPPKAGGIAPGNPQLGATAAGLNPTLTWSDSSPFIFYYEIQLSEDPGFNTNPLTATRPVFWNYIHGGESQPLNSWVVPSSSPLTPGCRYYWRVRPRVQGNGAPVNWSPALWFMAPAAAGMVCQTTITPLPTPAVSPTVPVSGSPTPTASPAGTVTMTPTPTLGPGVTISATPTPTAGPAGTVTMTPTARVTPTPPATGQSGPTLTVTRAGDRGGTVTSLPAGINCGGDCSESYPIGTVILLSPAPDSESWFLGWSGDPDCSDGVVTMNVGKTCTATFDSASEVGDLWLVIIKEGSGSGTVTSNPAGINCGVFCSAIFDNGGVVTLTVVTEPGTQFVGWTGEGYCNVGAVRMASSQTCIAHFFSSLPATPTPAGTATPIPTPTPRLSPTATPGP